MFSGAGEIRLGPKYLQATVPVSNVHVPGA